MQKALFYILIIIPLMQIQGQEIVVICENKPLNEILIGIRENHSIQFSFNNEELSKYTITANQKFSSPDDALIYLLKGLPLTFEIKHGVYLIYEATVVKEKRSFLIEGQVVDEVTGEPLPFSHLLINQKGVITDFYGYYSFKSASDSVFKVKVSYLGYYLLDTVFYNEGKHNLGLKPSAVGLKEVIVEAEPVVLSVQAGVSSGTMRLNHKVATHLPGNGDNTIFNLLRLQPGIVATSEQSNELIIWGSYDGQNQALFDGYSIYKLKNYHDNISAVNPFMAKDIKVLKGGYDASYGNQVGGVVYITGVDGDVNKPSVNLSINNLTLNGMASIPVFKNSALTLAYRQTYYNLYEPFNIKTPRVRNTGGSGSVEEINAIPDYDFYDMNVKYSGKLKNGDNYYLSYFRGKDKFEYNIDEEFNLFSFQADRKEANIQNGASAFYGKRWSHGVRTNITLSYSSIETNNIVYDRVYRSQGNFENVRRDEDITSSRSTLRTTVSNYIPLNQFHALDLGVEVEENVINRLNQNFELTELDESEKNLISTIYLIDQVSLGNYTKLKAGIRFNHLSNLNNFYIQPRISFSSQVSETVRLTASWGMYNQYVAKTPLVDSLGNYSYYWSISDDEELPVLKAQHYVLGWRYAKNGFLISMEGFIKKTDGISTYFQVPQVSTDIYIGDSRSRGVDVFVKKDYKGHSAWISYTLSKTEERYPVTLHPAGRRPVYLGENYTPALHDQRHEVKVAGIFKVNSFYLSANYVYGSGFPERREIRNGTASYASPYSRLDASVIYKFNTEKIGLEAGFSVLNVLNTDNSSTAALERTISSQDGIIDIQRGAIPFTPTVYLNFSF